MPTTQSPTTTSQNEESKSFFSKYSPIVCQLPDFRDSRRHALCKWRHTWDASDQFSMQIGADCVQNSNIKDSLRPWIGVKLLQDPEKPDDGWAVEVSTDMAVLQCPTVDIAKPFRRLSRRIFCRKDKRTDEDASNSTENACTIPVNARIGTDFFNDNAPHIEIGVKNKAVICGMLACSLALQKPMAIHVKRKEVSFGSYGGSGTQIRPAMEVDGRLRRRGWQILIQIDDLIPVLRTSSNASSSSPCCCGSSADDTL